MRRPIYRGPPRDDDERRFFDSTARLLRVPKDEVDEREREWKAKREVGRSRPPNESGDKVNNR